MTYIFFKCLKGIYEVYILKYFFFDTSLIVVPAARPVKNLSRKRIFEKLNVLKRAILIALFTYRIIYHKKSEEM